MPSPPPLTSGFTFADATLLLVFLFVYFLPSIWAFHSDKNSKWIIFILNFLPPMWLIAGLWALAGRTRADAQMLATAMCDFEEAARAYAAQIRADLAAQKPPEPGTETAR